MSRLLRRSRVSETPDYDPRYSRAQTVEGAKARYVAEDVDYSLLDLERDVARLLDEGDYPDGSRAETGPILGGQVVMSDGGDPANEKLDSLLSGGERVGK